TLRQYKHDPTRPAYYTARGMSHREAIKAAQGERKQRGLPGLGYALYSPGIKTRRAQRQPRDTTGSTPTLKGVGAPARRPPAPPEPRVRPRPKPRATANQADVDAVLGVQAVSAPDDGTRVHIRTAPTGKVTTRVERAPRATARQQRQETHRIRRVIVRQYR